MSRPREFDHEHVLDSAMQVFWSRGYDGTTMRELVSATGLQPGSLYGAFANKRNLFKMSLCRYESRIDLHIVRLRDFESTPLESIRQFFKYVTSECDRDSGRRGCLFINTLLQVPSSDIEITRQVNLISDKLETVFRELLLKAQQSGELDAQNDPHSLARLLMVGLFGLRVYNKTSPEPMVLQQIVDDLLKCFD
jgi:TetR/AcrR family transcriptional regulator, transcriptional repressor for nem operon